MKSTLTLPNGKTSTHTNFESPIDEVIAYYKSYHGINYQRFVMHINQCIDKRQTEETGMKTVIISCDGYEYKEGGLGNGHHLFATKRRGNYCTLVLEG